MPKHVGFSLFTKKLTLILMSFAAFAAIVYHLYFFIQPSVTITNNSQYVIEKASVTLPNSHLNFGTIAPNNTNTIYYALDQNDGSYLYQFTLKAPLAREITGECGYVTHGQYHKRVSITLTANLTWDCQVN
ncbi:hypothetical protein [Thalassotalea euphylliae]|uniref:Uncharacterized protein n=1 Tax=Thalassotalea euphylliae TaxID=1655234 RepID=A0A3E0TYS5_9GAMM|nr:hypothetical protein [Thalassotalea euphylliae]REL29806.1 hypothetical protein DXX94_03275 [Thalassotalea euphylliae]